MNNAEPNEVCRQSTKKSLKYTESETMMVVEYFLKYRGYLMGEQSKNISAKKKELIWQFITSKLNEVQPVKRQWHQTRKRIADIKQSIRFKNIEAKKHANQCDPSKPQKIKYTPSEERLAVIMTREEWHSLGGTDNTYLVKSQTTVPALPAQDPVLPDMHAVENEPLDYKIINLENTTPSIKEEDHVTHKHYEENAVNLLNYDQPGPSIAEMYVLYPGLCTQPQSYTRLDHDDQKNVMDSADAPVSFATAERANDAVHTIQPTSVKRILVCPPLEKPTTFPVNALPYCSDESHGTPSRAYEPLHTQRSQNANISHTSAKGILGSETMIGEPPAPYIISPSNTADPVAPLSQNSSTSTPELSILGSKTIGDAPSAPNNAPPSNSNNFHGTPRDAPVMSSVQKDSTSTISAKGRWRSTTHVDAASPTVNIISPSASNFSHGASNRSYDALVTQSSENATTRLISENGKLDSPTLRESIPDPNITSTFNSDDFHGTPSRNHIAPVTSNLENVSTRITPEENLLGSPTVEEAALGPHTITPSNAKVSENTPSKVNIAFLTPLSQNASTKHTPLEGMLGTPLLEGAAPATGPSTNYDDVHGTPSSINKAPVTPALENIGIRSISAESLLGRPTQGEATPTPSIFPVYSFQNFLGSPETQTLTGGTAAASDVQGRLLECSLEHNNILRAMYQQTEIHNQNMYAVCSWLEKITIALCRDPCRSCAGGAVEVIGQMQETLACTNNVMKEIRDHLKTRKRTQDPAHTQDRASSPESSDSASPSSEEQTAIPSDHSSSNDSFCLFGEQG